MEATYYKCHHDRRLLDGCSECEKEKHQIMQEVLKRSKEDDHRIPIYRECGSVDGLCNCTGRCKEIVGYY